VLKVDQPIFLVHIPGDKKIKNRVVADRFRDSDWILPNKELIALQSGWPELSLGGV
jgi:hypothetical protein